MKYTLDYLFLAISAFILGLLASGFGWVMYLLVFDLMPKKAEVFVMEEYRPADITVDVASSSGRIRAPWTGFAQGGEEAGVAMLEGTQTSMRQLKPSYIRLDHIFDDDYYGLVSKQDGNLRLDWTKLDETVNDITQMGAKPFFSLGYMPSSLASTKIDVPYQWSEWQWLVQQTIEHYSGAKQIEDVYYEVWNEPDLESFGSWKYYGDKSYIKLYDASARGALAARANSQVLPFKIGGPAITALYRNWVLALVHYTRAQNLPLDFISWHRYSYLPSQFEQDMWEVNAWLGPNHPYELVISEWGPDPGKTAVYSGQFAASHAVAVMRRVIDSLDWGFAFEVKDGPNQENFGWGVFTHNQAGLRPKPRYYAFALLKDMAAGPRLVMHGEGSSVVGWAVGDYTQANVILTNFSAGGAGEEAFPLRFTNLPTGNYRLQWEKLGGTQQNRVVSIEAGQQLEENLVLGANEVAKVKLSLLEQPPVKPRPKAETKFGKVVERTD